MNIMPVKKLILWIIIILSFSINISAYAHPQSSHISSLKMQLKKLEATFGGHIGVYAVNTANNQHIEYHANKRFPMQSTFKLMLVANVLHKGIKDPSLLQQKINYSKQDIVFWSPVTKKHLKDGMTVQQLCAATTTYSDNTAANLLMKKFGGPKALTAFVHSLDKSLVFRINHYEVKLNSNPKNIQDTSTPATMGKSLRLFAFGNFLSKSKRQQLLTWMREATTGSTRIRAGVPKGWLVADKTGTGDGYGVANDIGVIWPPNHKPIVVAIFTVKDKKNAVRNDKIVAAATRIVIAGFAKSE